MKKYPFAPLFGGAILCLFWAYVMMSTLIRELDRTVTYIDLGAIFFLGVLTGALMALGVVVRARQRA